MRSRAYDTRFYESTHHKAKEGEPDSPQSSHREPGSSRSEVERICEDAYHERDRRHKGRSCEHKRDSCWERKKKWGEERGYNDDYANHGSEVSIETAVTVKGLTSGRTYTIACGEDGCTSIRATVPIGVAPCPGR